MKAGLLARVDNPQAGALVASLRAALAATPVGALVVADRIGSSQQ